MNKNLKNGIRTTNTENKLMIARSGHGGPVALSIPFMGAIRSKWTFCPAGDLRLEFQDTG